VSIPLLLHPCRAPAQTAVVIKRLRAALDALLERKVGAELAF